MARFAFMIDRLLLFGYVVTTGLLFALAILNVAIALYTEADHAALSSLMAAGGSALFFHVVIDMRKRPWRRA